MESSGSENIASLGRESAPVASDGVALTPGRPGSLEARHRALFALIFHEAGLEPDESTVTALAGALGSLGMTIRPLVTRW